ncbi:MAG TPA: type I DNA topoisomerase [Anaerolineaceae bacterium]|nr:type I DNA topoisomerase [Anaerolineaceae bacterium]
MEAYCVKCKEKREVENPQPAFNRGGTPITRGTCGVCGTTMIRTGRTSAHEGMKADEYLASQRSGKLVIVESPAKARTVGRFLGKGYTVRASVGHVRDLLRSSLSVDVENNFTPKYRVPNEKKEVVKELKELARQHSEIYLATDPDREGEAIAWHLMEAAQIEPKLAKRVVFHEITQTAIEDAFSHPREINMDLVNAQQARRVLDRLVGYSISPILWEKVRNRLSAGRVQSVALRLIVEREREIDAFIPVEYWTIAAEFKPQGIRSTYIAKLAKIDAVDPELPDEATVLPIVTDMEAATYSIARIKRGERRRKPLAPFITSTMQQEASRKLGYTARRTMSIAQQLYEGLDVGEGGSTGLITYMRTDSTNIAEVAQKEAREYIQQIYGQSFLPETPPQYKTRAVSAQEAHEAIRPTSVFRSPDKIKQYLTNDQFKLYQLVWQRFLASQMEAAVFDTLSIEIEAKTQIHEYLLRVSGSTVKFPGYLVVYEEAVDEDQKTEEENARIPSGLEEGQRQNLVRVIPEQHFTQPPPRYSEATLVQVLEEYGIGRPSTYAPILSTIQERGYVIREAKRLFPTETGILVNDIMVQHFPSIVDLHFTAHMEADLDQVAAGQEGWTDVVAEFYREFEPVLRRAQEAIPVTKAELEKIGRICPDCGGDLVIRWGRYGKFISCNNFPNCRRTEALLEKIGVKCPNDGGEIVIRKTRKGRIFYGCANYPNCEFTSWKQPIPVPCPKCGGLLVIANKREMQCTKCEETFLVEHVTEKSSETA